MKFGNRFKKQQPLIPHDIYLRGSDTSINTERARGGPSPVGWDQQQQHVEQDPSPTKKGLHVLKKLNCGAAMNNNKERYDDNLYPGFNPQHTFRANSTYVTPDLGQDSSIHHQVIIHEPQTQQFTPPPEKKNYRQEAPIVRPVLITVNDGDLGSRNHRPNQPLQHKEFKSTFLVTPNGTTVDPMRRTVTPEKEERKPKNCVMAPRRMQSNDDSLFEDTSSRNCMRKSPPRNPSPKSRKEDSEEMEELQRIARRNRWKRGFEKRWKDDSDLASASAFDESTYASSYMTYDSDYDDSYTEESLESSQWTGYTNRSKKDHRGQERRSKSLSRRRGGASGVFESVAEDLGVVASMLLSDGTSCISGAMDITRETIVSCKQN